MQSMHITKASDSGCIESAGFLMELVSSECTQPGTKRCMHHTSPSGPFSVSYLQTEAPMRRISRGCL